GLQGAPPGRARKIGSRLRAASLVVTPHAVTFTNRDLIVALSARLRLPAIYPLAFYAKAGGLISYGFDVLQQFQQAAVYVDRILRGAQPADQGRLCGCWPALFQPA